MHTKLSNLALATLIFGFSQLAVADTGFKDETELGIAAVSGNTNTSTYTFKELAIYDWNLNVIKGTFRYINTQNGGTDTVRNWDGGFRYERVLSPIFNIFAAYTLDSDIFGGYVQKNNIDLGGKYYLDKSEDFNIFFEAGLRNVNTHYPSATQSDSANNAARVYGEINGGVSKTATYRFWAEYVQSISSNLAGNAGYSTGQDYLFNAEPSVMVMLSQIFSLKVAYLFKYVNYLPPTSTALIHLDTIFTTALVAKF